MWFRSLKTVVSRISMQSLNFFCNDSSGHNKTTLYCAKRAGWSAYPRKARKIDIYLSQIIQFLHCGHVPIHYFTAMLDSSNNTFRTKIYTYEWKGPFAFTFLINRSELLRRNPPGRWVILIFSGQKILCQNNLKLIAFFLTFFMG